MCVGFHRADGRADKQLYRHACGRQRGDRCGCTGASPLGSYPSDGREGERYQVRWVFLAIALARLRERFQC